MRAAWSTLAAVLAAYAAVNVGGLGGEAVRHLFTAWVQNALLGAGAALTLLRAARRRRDRTAWALMGLGLAGWTAGNVGWAIDPDLPTPSWADPLYLLFYPCAYAALVLQLRSRVRRFPSSVWLDGGVAALAVASAAAALLVGPVRAQTGDAAVTVATSLAYPIGDVLLLALLGVIAALRRWRVSASWGALAAGTALNALADAAYTLQGSPSATPVLDVAWAASALLVAAGAWLPDDRGDAEGHLEGWRTLAVPLACAVPAIALLVSDHFDRSPASAVWLAGATLAAVVARMALTFRENLLLLDVRRQATTDELTGLENRRGFLARLDAALEGDPERARAVLIVDLDRFKELNDTLGHHAGDRLLELLGPRLGAAAGEGGLVARLGGDEFAVLLEDAGLQRAAEAGRRIAAELQRPFVVAGLELLVDASVGAALAPGDGTDGEALLARADVAMRQAKESRTGFQAYDAERDGHSRERLEVVAELRRGLERHELVLHYQPKVALADGGRLAGVEALVRWQHPVHGLRGPGAFLPHAEQTGLMRPLTLWVLDEALRSTARWRGGGLELHVGVNLAVHNLLDVRTPELVAGLLERHGVPPRLLTLEVTESLMVQDPQRAGEILGELRRLGVGLALDDFGTGFSSLEHLKALPVDELKIDRSFVMRMDDEPADRAIVAATVALGRALGLRVVAEGVETATTARVLAAIGCDLAQGFYFSRPVPGEEIAELARRAQAGVAGLADPGPELSAGAPRPWSPAAVTPRPAT